MIRIDVKAGHGAGMPVSKQIEQNVDLFGFTLHNMGINKVMF
jgi:prolyl oligopeptidase